MSSRRPPRPPRETQVDRRIREAEERGYFRDLAGSGKPIPDLDTRADALWWVRRKLREEQLSRLPETLQVRRDVEVAREEIARARTEAEVREILAAINARVRHVNRTAIDGPPSTTMPLDVERTVAAWREQRAARQGRGTEVPPPGPGDGAGPRRRRSWLPALRLRREG